MRITLFAGFLAMFAALQPASADSRVRAQLVSPNHTTLSAEVSATLTRLPFREGDAFRANDLIASFDCALYQAQRDKSEAQYELARESRDTTQRLHDKGISSDLELFQTESKLKETKADAEAAEVSVNRCEIHAPYNGRVARLLVAEHQYVTAGMPLLEIVESEKLEVQAVVPSNWLAWLKIGDSFVIHIDELNRDYRVRIVRLAARIDAVSQMAPVVGRIEVEHGELLPGMSGWASFRKGR